MHDQAAGRYEFNPPAVGYSKGSDPPASPGTLQPRLERRNGAFPNDHPFDAFFVEPNPQRKDFPPSEAVAIKRALEPEIRVAGEIRMKAAPLGGSASQGWAWIRPACDK